MNRTRHPYLDDFRFGQTRGFEFAGFEEFLELHAPGSLFLCYLVRLMQLWCGFGAVFAALVSLYV